MPRARRHHRRYPRPTVNSLVLNRWLRRLSLPIMGTALIAMVLSYGVEQVPDGPLLLTLGATPGSTCVIAKRIPTLRRGALVFLATADGTALCRVDHADGDRVWFMERGAVAFPDGVPLSTLRGLLLSVIHGPAVVAFDDGR